MMVPFRDSSPQSADMISLQWSITEHTLSHAAGARQPVDTVVNKPFVCGIYDHFVKEEATHNWKHNHFRNFAQVTSKS